MARSEQQNERMRDDRRQKILSSAARLFARRGLAATKIGDIAAAAGMSHGLLYHYFPSKEAVFVEIVRWAFDQMNTAARALEQAPEPPRIKIDLAITQILKGLEQGEDFAWISTLISQTSISDAVPHEAREIIARERDVPYHVVVRILRAGQADGTIRPEPAERLALVFWATVKGLALHKATVGEAFEAPPASILRNLFFEAASS